MGELLTFKHGVHPKEYKHLSDKSPIIRMPFVHEYILPLSQHIGAPSKPLVRKGQYVKRGEKIADPSGFVSVALHSPVDGEVIYIGLTPNPNGQATPAIKIKADPFSAQTIQNPHKLNYLEMDNKTFITEVQNAGIVGLGGAAFPAHVKFSIPEGKTCSHLILNGCECEPFLTSDHRLMLEYPDRLLRGIEILNHFIGEPKVHIGVERNKLDAIAILKQRILDRKLNIEVNALKVKYPQGAEKMLIKAILGKEVPVGKLPLDVEVLVSNIGSIVALDDYFNNHKPLIERVVTVTGTAVRKPANVLVPIGTPMRDVVDLCGGITADATRILFGGPMMGAVQKSIDVPVIKGTSGILILTDNEVRNVETYNCVRCGRCVDACPMHLNPSFLGLLARKALYEDMMEYNIMDCFECGSCSFVCPSGIPLVQSFRVSKAILREQKAKESSK